PGASITLVADRGLLEARARRLKLRLRFREAGERGPGIAVDHVPLRAMVRPGRLDPANAEYVLDTLRRAVARVNESPRSALVTGPVHKGVINDAGIPFSGHTEFLAGLTGTPRVVMLLAAPRLRVALATTHLPLREVPAALARADLPEILRIIDRDLRRRFGIPRPRIRVTGLNPHAGEQGHLGREEIELIEPAIRAARAAGLRVDGPWPADTLFTPRQLAGADVVLAMYHDQGLPVLKHSGFGAAVNVTLGLPIVRTSVDHGTALDLAGTGKADAGSLAAAIGMALALCASRVRSEG
ncbi:MAG TPA: 4-hydroxythreonine-4-phosphate dehydrogenase PdxA, partial [Solimonas sp.]|nr:4-hydroxythreonine-4-phosphate dehydrogenase PdxA [Solimonas sp.]